MSRAVLQELIVLGDADLALQPDDLFLNLEPAKQVKFPFGLPQIMLGLGEGLPLA